MVRPDAVPESVLALRRWRRRIGGLGLLGLAICAALVVATQTGPESPAGGGRAGGRGPARAGPEPAQGPGPGRPAPAPSGGGERPTPTKIVRLRVRVVDRGEAAPDAVVRAVRFEERGTVRALSAPARAGSDGVAELEIDAGGGLDGWLEVALADSQGMRHGYRDLGAALAAPDAPAELEVPGGGCLRIRVEGLPPESVPEYADVRFLTPEGDFERLFPDGPTRPVEDGSLFESKSLPRTQRVKLRPDGTAELPCAPADHGIVVEFPRTPPGWLVAESGYSGPCVVARTGDVLRVDSGTRCEYRVRFARMPVARILVVDAADRPISGATVVAGLRTSRPAEAERVFESFDVTGADGALEVPLWTGARLPDWTPTGLLVVAAAPGKAGRVVETTGGWYPDATTIRLEDAPDGEFFVEGRLRHPDGRAAGGVPVRVVCEPPWNGHAALPVLSATTAEDGSFRIRVAEAHRSILARAGGGLGGAGAIRVETDSERLEAQSEDALWRRLYPGLSRATTTPARLALPERGGTLREVFVLDIPPP